MIVAPPGEPTASTGVPSRWTIVGDMLERGRLPGAGELARPGVGSKSVSSLLSRNPRPGTTIALPPVCSIVNVYDTTMPCASATVRCVVDGPSSALECEPDAEQSPGSCGVGSAFGPISDARESANGCDSRHSS